MSEDEQLSILKEIRDNQAKALALQEKQYELVSSQFARTEAIQDKAEKIQDRAAGMFKVVFPLIVICIIIMFGLLVMIFS